LNIRQDLFKNLEKAIVSFIETEIKTKTAQINDLGRFYTFCGQLCGPTKSIEKIESRFENLKL
jgi:hypothetical protein